ncbi:MAG: DUF368 domain-containing protein [Candidatus Cryptobacteroides sp.]
MKSLLKYAVTAVKGACMGAADVIPGVSGGTIAFMTGIYEELIGSLNNFDSKAVSLLFKGKIKDFWKHVNGNFLVAVFAGILASVLSLAKLMQHLLTFYPIQTWSFFFGLIVASSLFILKGIKDWKIKDFIILAIGIILGVVICTLSPTTTPESLWFIFICGALAICAMILPGISGSFILLILGKYQYIMANVAGLTDGDFGQCALVLVVFAIGAVVGLLSFSKFLHWLLGRFHKQTLLVLAGFIIGSLVKVWPWSNMDAILRSQFPELLDADSSVIEQVAPMFIPDVDMKYWLAILFAVIGFCTVTVIELIATKSNKKDN